MSSQRILILAKVQRILNLCFQVDVISGKDISMQRKPQLSKYLRKVYMFTFFCTTSDRCDMAMCVYVCMYLVVTSLLYIVERLDIIAKQASLQFTIDSLRTDVRIGSDAFCVRLLLSATGDIKDVQLYHGIGVRDLHTGHVTESRVGLLLNTLFLNINHSVAAAILSPTCL